MEGTCRLDLSRTPSIYNCEKSFFLQLLGCFSQDSMVYSDVIVKKDQVLAWKDDRERLHSKLHVHCFFFFMFFIIG